MKIKICGITNIIDARIAVGHGADFIGFVFHKDSPRYVEPDTVKNIIKQLPEETRSVGVFVNETNENMISISRFCRLHTLQLHGQESIEQITGLRNIGVIKAFSPRSEQEVRNFQAFSKYTILIDSPSDKFGGSGKVGDWELARKVSSCYKTFLAGGLTCENIEKAVETVAPYGVDVSSGVEKKKGVKDPEKVRKFIEIIRKLN